MELNLIKREPILNKIIETLIIQIFFLKFRGINKVYSKIYNSYNYIYIFKISSGIGETIKLNLIKLSFLRCLNKKNTLLDNCVYGSCVECGFIHAQYKYKRCGHYVGLGCAYLKSTTTNKCAKCTKEIVKRKIDLVKGEKNTCSICLEECKTKLSKCGHHFHKKCIKLAYKTSNSCPMCRSNLVELKKKTVYKNKKITFHKNYKDKEIDLIIVKI